LKEGEEKYRSMMESMKDAAYICSPDFGIGDAEVVPNFGLGDRVFHQKFGYGAVIEVDGDKLSVAFEKAGQKKVIASYVTGAGEVPF